MSILIHLALGLLFGLGLVVSGMADPAKVLNFLDISGTWDPSLAFVMGGAVAVTALGYKLVLRRGRPLFATAFRLPGSTQIDARIIVGPALFGLGWGLGGFCPGPAITALGFHRPGTIVFVVAMVLGITAVRLVLHAPRRWFAGRTNTPKQAS